MIVDDADIDTNILNYIAQKGFVRTGELIDYFARKGHKRNETKGADKTNEENKKSIRTIQRRLENMRKLGGPIVSPTSKQLKKYGIKDEDGRAKYLTLRETIERDRDLDEMFKLLYKGKDHDKGGDLEKESNLDKEDYIDTKMVLHELKRYEKRYVLYPSQLDILVLKLDSQDDGLIDSLLKILYNYIINKEIKPSNKDEFLEKLRNVLSRYQQGHTKYTMLRRHVIRLLGIYDDDKTIFAQIEKDIKSGKLSDFKNDYLDRFTAKIIEKRWKDFFYLERRLRKEGNEENADILKEIRDKAEENACKPIEPDKSWEEITGSQGQLSNLNIKGIKK